MQYSKKVIKHFQNPHNQGKIKNADAIGQAGNPVCGDVMKIYLRIDRKQKTPACQASLRTGRENRKQKKLSDFIIKDIKFETLGCAAAIAVSSALTDIVKGMTLDQVMKLKKEKIVKDLGGLPPVKIHCSMLGLEALHKAIEKYEVKSKKK